VRENLPLEQVRDSAGAASGAEAVAALVDALRPLDREKTELLRAAAHGLRTPLTSIVGFLELLREGAAGPLAPEQERVVRTVVRNVAQLTALVDLLEPAPARRAATAVRPDDGSR
jgi:signal transduction histidine kinase